MDPDVLVPWFPAWGVNFPKPIENIFSIVSEFNEFRPSNRWLLASFDVIASEVHLWGTWYSLRRNEESGSMVAKTPDAEFLRILAGTHQISRAFERAGLSEGDARAWIISLPEIEIGEGFGEFKIPRDCYSDLCEEGYRIIEQIGGSIISKRPVPSEEGLEKLGSSAAGSSRTGDLEGRFLAHMALADLR